MESRTESAWRTLLRIEVVCLQGMFYVILRSLFGAVMIPAIFLADFWDNCKWGFRDRPWWIALLMLVPWLALALLQAVLVPFNSFGKGLVDIIKVANAEWRARRPSADEAEGQPHDYLADVLDDYAEPLDE